MPYSPDTVDSIKSDAKKANYMQKANFMPHLK